MKEKKKMGLGVRILLGMVLGIIVGAILWALLGVDKANEIATAYIKPFGDIFVNLLKYIVVPLVLLSIMDGVISMGDIGKVGKIGWKTIVYFLIIAQAVRQEVKCDRLGLPLTAKLIGPAGANDQARTPLTTTSHFR